MHFPRTLGLLLAVSGVASARPAFSPDGTQRFAHYEVITSGDPAGGGIVKARAVGLLDATPDEVFRVATDYARYVEFAPRVVSADVVDRQGDQRALVMMKTNLPWPVSAAWVYAQFETDHLGPDSYRIRFWQLKGSLKRYFGSILIEPWQKWKGGGTTAITYELLAEPDTSAPRYLINGRVEQAASKYVHALRQRINDLRRAGRIHPSLPPDPNLGSPTAGPKRPARVTDIADAKK
jgi:ribosome-associated toxin RatA of RatAB toxin-antitoxin module